MDFCKQAFSTLADAKLGESVPWDEAPPYAIGQRVTRIAAALLVIGDLIERYIALDVWLQMNGLPTIPTLAMLDSVPLAEKGFPRLTVNPEDYPLPEVPLTPPTGQLVASIEEVHCRDSRCVSCGGPSPVLGICLSLESHMPIIPFSRPHPAFSKFVLSASFACITGVGGSESREEWSGHPKPEKPYRFESRNRGVGPASFSGFVEGATVSSTSTNSSISGGTAVADRRGRPLGV